MTQKQVIKYYKPFSWSLLYMIHTISVTRGLSFPNVTPPDFFSLWSVFSLQNENINNEDFVLSKDKTCSEKKNKPISTYIVPKSSQTYMYIPFKTYLNRHKYTYPLKHVSFTLWSICPWTLQVIYLWPFIYDFFFQETDQIN